MNNELLYSGSVVVGTTISKQSQFRSASTLYIQYEKGFASQVDLNGCKVQLSIKGKRSAPIIDADLNALAQFADVIAGVGASADGEVAYCRIPIGNYALDDGEFFTLTVNSSVALTNTRFLLVSDDAFSAPQRIQSFLTISDYTSPKLLQAFLITTSGISATISGEDGYSISGEDCKLIALANAIEDTENLDIGVLYQDATNVGKSITLRSTSAMHILCVEGV